MNLLISYSGRKNGNCDLICNYIAAKDDHVVHFRDLNVHECSNCDYECFNQNCKYRQDDIYTLYKSMTKYNKIILVVPIYCGNPSSLYFKFNERSQDYFMHNQDYDEIISRLYVIGIYGDKESNPDFIPCLQKWFDNTKYSNRVLGIERHKYGQRLYDNILNVEEVKNKISIFIKE